MYITAAAMRRPLPQHPSPRVVYARPRPAPIAPRPPAAQLAGLGGDGVTALLSPVSQFVNDKPLEALIFGILGGVALGRGSKTSTFAVGAALGLFLLGVDTGWGLRERRGAPPA